MQGLQTPHQVLRRASESFGSSHIKNMNATLLFAKLVEYFFLSEGVVLKFLGRLCRIDMRREHIMQTELTRKHVHHHSKRIVGSYGVRIVFIAIPRSEEVLAGTRRRESIQGILNM